MSNLTRYDFEDGDIMDGIGGSMVVSIDGEYVKFDDIKELLNSSHNRLSADKVQALPKGQGTEIAALVKQDIAYQEYFQIVLHSFSSIPFLCQLCCIDKCKLGHSIFIFLRTSSAVFLSTTDYCP